MPDEGSAARGPGDLALTPPAERVASSRLSAFGRWLHQERGRGFGSYEELRAWSVSDLDGFWNAVVDFFDVDLGPGRGKALAEERMPGAVWFPGASVNYAARALSFTGSQEAVVSIREGGGRTVLTRDQLRTQVASVAAWLRARGVGPGDRVAGYLPNIAETGRQPDRAPEVRRPASGTGRGGPVLRTRGPGCRCSRWRRGPGLLPARGAGNCCYSSGLQSSSASHSGHLRAAATAPHCSP